MQINVKNPGEKITPPHACVQVVKEDFARYKVYSGHITNSVTVQFYSRPVTFMTFLRGILEDPWCAIMLQSVSFHSTSETTVTHLSDQMFTPRFPNF